MPSEPRNWEMRIQHILDAIAETREFISGMTYEQFCKDARTLKAVVANLILIGEAARYVPEEVQIPDIPWPQMRGMRNHIVHGYDQIDLEIVWNVVRDELPPLVPKLQCMLRKEGTSETNPAQENGHEPS